MTETIEHVLEAANPIIGTARFVSLRLGETWDLAQGVGHPEINASHERRSIRWVANGDFWYVLYDDERHWAMEFHGRFRPDALERTRPGSGLVSVAGHAAEVLWSHRRRGLPWRRHDVTFMTVEYDCPQSERSIMLEFSGWCPEEGFREVLASLARLRCH
ncbi:MAG: hypothetical protein A2Z37_00250 [Chloroflexi bacterium RBG_19FT_COMBO_62_14]|nr:MAG: hypothetical protein A2Z37_00250 [Chloroflexi bacterium RBG_19FT_COMBO_62_14]